MPQPATTSLSMCRQQLGWDRSVVGTQACGATSSITSGQDPCRGTTRCPCPRTRVALRTPLHPSRVVKTRRRLDQDAESRRSRRSALGGERQHEAEIRGLGAMLRHPASSPKHTSSPEAPLPSCNVVSHAMSFCYARSTNPRAPLVCAHTYAYVHVYTYAYVSICVYVLECICTCRRVCAYVYIPCICIQLQRYL